MRFIIFPLLFLFCYSNIGALEKNRDSEVLEEKTREMMDQINRILRDFYNSVKDSHNPYNGRHSEIEARPYHKQDRVAAGPNYLEHQRQHGENMRLFYNLQARYADLERRSKELKRLKEEWVNNKYDRSIQEKYAVEQEEYNRLFALYKQDLERHDEMKRMLRAR